MKVTRTRMMLTLVLVVDDLKFELFSLSLDGEKVRGKSHKLGQVSYWNCVFICFVLFNF